ncbi:putative membrane protein [Flavobacteriaceae bacterium MAR_2010_72]|nr:putative membrane protein [Flavobacteriaceae bacterium MAR_2010_72]
MNLSEFFGRLHPLIVHLPIGFLMIAILLEFYFRNKMSPGKRKSIIFILVLGAVGSIIAALFGWLLAEEGGFNEDTLFWHRWLGISTAVIAILALWSKYKSQRKVYIFSLVALSALLMLTGHFGGSLTHGSDYLLQPLMADNSSVNSKELDKPNDSIVVFHDIVKPFIDAKCISCHNDDKQNGGLNLSTFEHLEIGGDNGKILHSNVWESEFFRRVTLPQESEKFMPPNGIPLTYNETTLLKWWIENGAEPETSIIDSKLNDAVKNILLNEYNIDLTPKPFAESITLQALSETVISNLENKGWSISVVSPNSNLLDASPKNGVKFTSEMLKDLLAAKKHITWLKLGNTSVNNEDLKRISQFENLTDLRLNDTKITDEGLSHISKLNNLEALNIYDTTISDEGLNAIKALKKLKRIYLWKTKVTPSGISELQDNKPKLTIISG